MASIRTSIQRLTAFNDENATKGANIVAGGKVQADAAPKRAALGDIGNIPKLDAVKDGGIKKVAARPPSARARVLTKPQAAAALIGATKQPGVPLPRPAMPAAAPVEVAQHADMMDVEQPAPVGFSAALLASTMAGMNIEDIDHGDNENPLLVSEYVSDIYEYLWSMERQYRIDTEYMSRQPEVNVKMRAILIDWLVEVQLKFKLLQETLYLTVHIIDRFLGVEAVERSRLQLVGVTAMLIAAKYEEIYTPEVMDFVFITESAYERDEILAMERLILRKLEFSLGCPAPLHFLRRDSKAAGASGTLHTMAKFLMEITLPEYGMLKYLPSEIAAAALWLSMRLTNEGAWNSTIQHYSTYSERALMPCVNDMFQILTKLPSNRLQAIRRKYQSSKLFKVAAIAECAAASITIPSA